MNGHELPKDESLGHLKGILRKNFEKALNGLPCMECYYLKDLVTRRDLDGVAVYFVPIVLQPLINALLDEICGVGVQERPKPLGDQTRPENN